MSIRQTTNRNSVGGFVTLVLLLRPVAVPGFPELYRVDSTLTNIYISGNCSQAGPCHHSVEALSCETVHPLVAKSAVAVRDVRVLSNFCDSALHKD